MQNVIDILAANPLLLLFVVAAIGFPLGRIRVAGGSLGVAAILFTGLAIGSIDPRLKLPDLLVNLGLVLFVYTVGLSSGPGFVASMRGRGLAANGFAQGVILLAGALTTGAHFAMGLAAPAAAGMFAGSLTNTPALAGVVELLASTGQPAEVQSQPVIGYSLAYPVSVLGMIVALYVAQRIWRVDFAAERMRPEVRGLGGAGPPITSRTVAVAPGPNIGVPIGKLVASQGWRVVFGRLEHDGRTAVAGEDDALQPGDLVSVVGPEDEVEKVVDSLGTESERRLETDRSAVEMRNILVSNRAVAGRTLRELAIPQHHGALVTRVRRGDVELPARGNTMLEPGDRVRVIAERDRMPAVVDYFGDSMREVSEIDVVSFSLGLALGVMLGLLTLPLPGGIVFKLGLAGGPLVAGLLLGALGRTGPIVWTLPYSANMMLRQVGLVLFLAGVGTRSGYDFARTLASGEGLSILGAAVVIVAVVALVTLWVGRRVLRLSMGVLSGVLAGIQTQPATLGFGLEQSRDDLPNVGYATVYPLSMIAKLVLAQLLLVWLGD
jgi:putative transport protein